MNPLAEVGILARVIAAIGLISMFTIAVAVWAGVPGPPAMGSLSNIPVFDNPFSSAHRHYILQPDGNDPTNTYAPSTGIDQFETEAIGVDDPHCDTNNQAGYLADPTSEYWGCIATTVPTAGEAAEPDGYQTRVTLAAGAPDMQVSLGTFVGVDSDHLIQTVLITFNCLSGSSDKVFITFSFATSGGAPLPGQAGDFNNDACLTDGFGNHTSTLDVSLAGVTIADYNDGMLYIASGGTPAGAVGTILLTWVSVEFIYSPTRECTGSAIDQANCYISQFLQFVLDILTFILNLLIFVVDWIVFIATFIGDLIGILLWFYAIPGLPAPMQGILDVAMTALIGTVVYILARLIRGSGPV